MAVRRLGWGCTTPAEVYVPERVRRIAEEEAARALRLALHRRAVLAAVCATWPADPGRRSEAEWRALRAALPTETSAADIRNRTRQVRAHLAEHKELPADVTEVEGSPAVAAQVLLAAADKQLVALTRNTTTDATASGGAPAVAGDESGTAVPGGPDTAVLRVKLPLVAAPASRADWAWHVIAFTVPPHVPEHAAWCAPTLRVAAHRLRVDLPFTVSIPTVPAVGHRVGLGVDWGVNTLLTGTVARLIDDQADGAGSGPTGTPNGGCVGGRVISDGRMLRYDATAISAKLHRLRTHREHLATKRDHYAALLPGLSAPHPQWAAAERIVARGLLGQAHTHTDRITGHRTITVVVEGNVSRARRPRAETRRVRRANRTGRDTFTRPDRPGPTAGKGRPTPKRPGRPHRPAQVGRGEVGLSQAFRRVPEWRTVPAPPWWDSVRRDTNPRAATVRWFAQVVHAISSTGPVSTAPAPPPSSALAQSTDPARERPHRPDMSEILRQPQEVEDAMSWSRGNPRYRGRPGHWPGRWPAHEQEFPRSARGH
ncbi:hypothetical protein [Streptosporangium subroseum]|uniref:hypothetical protein n=1 Tax=Streptosporangium subroseum TaxID=106412 RepID=UPI0030858F1C|nr:hypothetical protein OHB15_26965 [Streptosporangium subroseum]